ncbi:MAG: (2Fe-2S)-binding protein [Helicobacteraceae bacterium]|jgi:NADH-quinone oxidoreductase subunit G|nr:(2Fe-2S)-binding protein [Helicobacteraceae bacterium]
MVSLTIDERLIEANEGETILQAARNAGVYIPTLCYLSSLSAAGSCRLCVVEIDGVSGFALSCQTKVKEGIKVTTNSAPLFETRKRIVQMICVNHPLECGVCDKSGECELQDKALEFKVSDQIFCAKEQSRAIEEWEILTYDPSLCILCERCVRTCNEIVACSALSIAAGGYNSKIAFDSDRCSKCGECAAVCPVGAIVTKDFKYTANAWELTKTPSVCLYCPCGCENIVETKRGEIKRVGRDLESGFLCALGRFGFKKAPDLIEFDPSAKSVGINGDETNEEIYLLNERGYKLVNNSIADFQTFLTAYAKSSGETLCNATINETQNSDTIILFAPSLSEEAPLLKSAIARASLINGADIFIFAPFEDNAILEFSTRFIRYETGSEEGVFALLLKTLIKKPSIALKAWLDNLDDGNLSAETNAGEEEFNAIAIGKKTTIVIGSEIYSRDRAENIAIMAGFLRKFGFDILMIPPTPNALGISLIADVYNGESQTCFWRAANEAKEGTIVTIDRVVKPLNAAISRNLWIFGAKRSIDVTPLLPFNDVSFDRLTPFTIDVPKIETELERPDTIGAIGEYNGAVVHYALVDQPFKIEGELIGSEQFALANRLKNGDNVKIKTKVGVIKRRFIVSPKMKGTIARLEVFDLAEVKTNLRSRYEIVNLQKGELNG